MKTAWRSTGAGTIAILALTVLVYLPAMRGGFIWDDGYFITKNRVVKASDGLYRIWFTTETPHYYPLTWSLCWLEWRLWDGKATGYHVVNVLLHAVNAVLVWLILRRLKIPGAWLAAAVFAVHPVNVATAAWISEQKNTLSMLFYAVAILLYLRFDEEDRSPQTNGSSRVLLATSGRTWYGLSLGTFLLALLSKSAVLMLPTVLLGCVWWRHGRLRWKDWLYSVPFFVLSLASGLVTIWFEHRAFEERIVRADSFLSRLAAAGWMPWFYLSKALGPVDLTMVYPKWEVDASHWVSYVPGIILIGCLIVFWRKRETWGRPWLFGLGYFVVTLFPVLGFFDQSFYRFSLVADHWQYYSIVGVIALAVAAGAAISRRMGERHKYVNVLTSVAVLMVLGVITWRRGCVYADAETLWRDNVAKNPNAWVAHYNLGVILREAHRSQEAITHYQEALRIKPGLAEGHYSLGLALGQIGRSQEAIGHYEQALRIEPHYVMAQNNLAWLLATLAPPEGGDPVRAVTLAKQACERAGNQAVACLDTLAVAYAAAGRFNDAVVTSQKAIELARSAGQPELVGEFEARLRLYRDRRPYHSPDDVTRPHKP